MRVLLIDNYDSFTWNLVHYLGELGGRLRVVRNDAIDLAEIETEAPEAVVLSPGPCTPNEAGVCLPLIETFATRMPILGVCLGHQAIGQAFGGRVVRAPAPVHGKTSRVRHEGRGLFRGINETFQATRYHSLLVERATLPDTLDVTAETEDGLIMGLSHRRHCVHGVQFHPESIASEHGKRILATFLELAREFNASSCSRAA